ncbi:hypothetical protein WS87_08670 [Burkholderia sp. MSMB0856]|nr:hypothetical protein WS87_08670 [Burkholderia sp. MSMB0856]
MVDNYWLELLIIACSIPLLAHHFRVEQMTKVCKKIPRARTMSFFSMIYLPRYWHLWSVKQWETYLVHREDFDRNQKRN